MTDISIRQEYPDKIFTLEIHDRTRTVRYGWQPIAVTFTDESIGEYVHVPLQDLITAWRASRPAVPTRREPMSELVEVIRSDGRELMFVVVEPTESPEFRRTSNVVTPESARQLVTALNAWLADQSNAGEA